MGSRRSYAVDSDLCLCRCVNPRITKFWRSNGFLRTRAVKQASCFCDSLQQFLLEDLVNFARTSSGYVVPEVVWYTESRHISRNSNGLDVSSKFHISEEPLYFHVFSIPLHITIDGHIAEQISRLRSNAWSQAAVLSTCNRFELYFASPEQKSWTWLKISWVLLCNFRRKDSASCVHTCACSTRLYLHHILQLFRKRHTFSWSRPGALHQLLGTLWQQSVPCVWIHLHSQVTSTNMSGVGGKLTSLCNLCSAESAMSALSQRFSCLLVAKMRCLLCELSSRAAFLALAPPSFRLEWVVTCNMSMCARILTYNRLYKNGFLMHYIVGFSQFLSHWFLQGPPPQHTTDRSLGARHATSAGATKLEPQQARRQSQVGSVKWKIGTDEAIPHGILTTQDLRTCFKPLMTRSYPNHAPGPERQHLEPCDLRPQRCFCTAWLPCDAPPGAVWVRSDTLEHLDNVLLQGVWHNQPNVSSFQMDKCRPEECHSCQGCSHLVLILHQANGGRSRQAKACIVRQTNFLFPHFHHFNYSSSNLLQDKEPSGIAPSHQFAWWYCWNWADNLWIHAIDVAWKEAYPRMQVVWRDQMSFPLTPCRYGGGSSRTAL